MLPTLEPGDRLVVLRSFAPKAGDLVAVRDPDEPSRLLVKRLIAREPGRLTVVGDNAASSRDSRAFGPVARRDLVGRAVYRYHPPARAGRLGRRDPHTEWSAASGKPDARRDPGPPPDATRR